MRAGSLLSNRACARAPAPTLCKTHSQQVRGSRYAIGSIQDLLLLPPPLPSRRVRVPLFGSQHGPLVVEQ